VKALYAIAVVLGALAASCAHAPPSLTLRMEPQADSNRGLAVYVLVRAVTPQRFAAQDYRTVAALVETPDDSVRASAVLFPTRPAQVVVPLRDGERLAVYGFFRDVGGRWRIMLNTPTPSRLRLRLNANALEVVPDGR
jgi:hypothetical protein